ncbi:MAG: cryptochrome/photolyase family protein [Desulfotignum sp.]|nr:cryptochrome/photolyase family protein [Desulfotignum sp.]
MAEDRILRLILGDQLNSHHSWFRSVDPKVIYLLMEIRQETDYVRHHIQKVVGFFAAMRSFAAWLSESGHRVQYLGLNDGKNRQTFEDNIKAIIKEEKITRFEYLLPDEYRLDTELATIASKLSIPSEAKDTEHFICGRNDVKRMFKGKKRFLMESFYRNMRRTHHILMDKGKPAGGRWNFDQSNRNRYDGLVPIPSPKVFDNNVKPIVQMVKNAGIDTIGKIQPNHFIWPVNRKQACLMLDEFVRFRLPYFGTYQDAMTTESWSLFHSRLSFALNTKMLHPMEVINAALQSASNGAEPRAGIEQIEGFVRQILGWREFMRGIYWHQMPEYENMNFFNHKTALPDYYWTGKTRMACMHAAITQSLEQAYAHHIQRLMVTGNFSLLAGVDPARVERWYLGIYIDAVQWVEIVNTLGMSQFADGGIVATKPYISSANYLHKMSDYCEHCYYRHASKTGERSCPFNSLYWDFLVRHQSLLEKNPRIGMMYRTWKRMKPENQQSLLHQAQVYRTHLNDL